MINGESLSRDGLSAVTLERILRWNLHRARNIRAKQHPESVDVLYYAWSFRENFAPREFFVNVPVEVKFGPKVRNHERARPCLVSVL